MISAWCDDLRLVLGQRASAHKKKRASAHKKNEIKDIPVLLDLLGLDGAIVTLDAMGCQREIAAKIRDKGGDYVLALKGNQGLLHEDVTLWFEEGDHENTESLQTVDGDKGRIETRSYTQCADMAWLRERHPQWAGLTSIGRVVSVREHDGETTRQKRYFVSSLPKDVTRFAHAVRSHWGIENRLHWVLDVTFRDNDSRVRKDHAPANFAVIKHIAMNLISKAKGKLPQGHAQKGRLEQPVPASNSANMKLMRFPCRDNSVARCRRGHKAHAGGCRARRRRSRARHPDLRSLVDCIRLVRRTAMQTAVRMITTGVMLALLAGIAIKLKIFGGGP